LSNIFFSKKRILYKSDKKNNYVLQGISDLYNPLKLSLEVGMETDVGKIITGHILGCIRDKSGKPLFHIISNILF
jgi:hypothetical protein